MSRIHSIYRRALGLFRKQSQDSEMAEEMRQHLEALIERNIAKGMSPEEARHTAHRSFGGVEQIKENCRDQRSLVWLEQLWRDFSFALRGLRKSPGFTTAAVLTLALGLSANIVIFSIISGMFLQPLPVKDPENLVILLKRSPVWPMPHGLSWSDYKDYKQDIGEFSDMLALYFTPAHISASGKQAERTYIEAVSANYFSMLGVEPAQGRFFLPYEGQKPGADPLVVLSHSCWQTQFGGDASIVGKKVQVNGHPFTVIGVAPATFHSAQWMLAPRAFIPATMLGQVMTGGSDFLEGRGAEAFKVMARLKPGVTAQQAKAALDVATKRLAPLHPWERSDTTMAVIPETRCRPEPSFSDFMPFAAAAFMVMGGLIMLIACANVTNLMFSRSLVRQRELGIRSAIGASRMQLLRQLLAESMLLALMAGALGFVTATVCGLLVTNNAPQGDIPVAVETHWDWRVTVFTLVASLCVGLITGWLPALRASKLDVQSILKGGPKTALGVERHRLRNLLVIGQVAICLVVLVCSGLFVQSLRQMSTADLGFRPNNLIMASIDLGLQGYTEQRGQQFHQQLVDKVKSLPGVESCALASSVPFDPSMMKIVFVGDEGRTVQGKDSADDGYLSAVFNAVDSGYFRTMGGTLLRGRDFTEHDKAGAPLVAIVNETMARQLWPNKDAVGQHFRFNKGGPVMEVVGLARDGKYRWISERPQLFFYTPLTQQYSPSITIHVRTKGDPLGLAPTLRGVMQALDPDLPIYSVRTMEAHLQLSAFALLPLRFGAGMVSMQGILGLLLSVLGLYSVIAYVVSQRTHEIGVRMALGAQKRNVLWMVSREGLKLILIGLIFGLLVAFGLVRLLTVLLYGLNPMSLPVFSISVALLVGVALLACYVPALRATKINPVEALRAE